MNDAHDSSLNKLLDELSAEVRSQIEERGASAATAGTPPMTELQDRVVIMLLFNQRVTADDVERAWRECVAKYGLTKDSRIGYSTGCNYPPDWGEHTMSLRPGDRTELQANMCFHMILGIWMDDWGLEISETFRVTDKGAECLADVPRPLVVKD